MRRKYMSMSCFGGKSGLNCADLLLIKSRKTERGLMMQAEDVMKTKHKAGFSLIEIMVAALLLAVLAVGGAAVLSHTGASIKIQGNKRIALELANARLETARVQNYYGLGGIIPPLKDEEDRYFLTDANRDHILDLNDGEQSDQITLGGKTYSMLTEIVRRSSDSSIDFNTEFLDVTVSVRYRPGSPEEVQVRSLFISPYVTGNEGN
jgi:prepilin-type N-terminal cleavage/methylation domain-containing protein